MASCVRGRRRFGKCDRRRRRSGAWGACPGPPHPPAKSLPLSFLPPSTPHPNSHSYPCSAWLLCWGIRASSALQHWVLPCQPPSLRLKAGLEPAAPFCLWALVGTESRAWASFLGALPLAPLAALPHSGDPCWLTSLYTWQPLPRVLLPSSREGPGSHLQKPASDQKGTSLTSCPSEAVGPKNPDTGGDHGCAARGQNVGPTSMRPVSGWKLREGSSVVTRHWMAQPLMRMFSCRRPRSGRLRPSATWIWAWTRSTLREEGEHGTRRGA